MMHFYLTMHFYLEYTLLAINVIEEVNRLKLLGGFYKKKKRWRNAGINDNSLTHIQAQMKKANAASLHHTLRYIDQHLTST